MISIDTFLCVLKDAIRRKPNDGQGKAIEEAKSASLFIVAGPGTGKTTTLTMRMLKLIFVDVVSPPGILATTFTKKAAQELRSRLLSWGYAVQKLLLGKEKVSKMDRLLIDRVDINQVRTGTIDSVCEELLHDFRDPGTDPPTPVLQVPSPGRNAAGGIRLLYSRTPKVVGIERVDANQSGSTARLCFMVTAMESQ